MGHPDFERIHAFASGALSPAGRRRAAAHLEGCARCRAVLASIPRVVRAVEAATDLPLPEGAWERILARRAAGERIIPPAAIAARPPTAPSAPAPGVGGRAVRRAAVLLVVVAGAASASVTLPLLRGWLRSPSPAAPAGAAPPPAAGAGSAAAASAAREPAPALPVSGVSVYASDGTVTVDVDAPDPGLRIRVRLVDGPELEARATGGAASAVFSPRPGRLRVRNAGPGELELLLPRGAARVTLRVDGEPYVLSQDGQMRVLGPAADSAGSELVLRVRGAP